MALLRPPGHGVVVISRDVIAMAAVGISHGVYDAIVCLGVCDKIVPGLVMGALAGQQSCPCWPMATGIPNAEKAAVQSLCTR